jgi:capsule biosynthesis phosphatase
MIHKEKCLVVDVDGTLCPIKREEEEYSDLIPYPEMVERLRAYKNAGFYIILATSRNMRTHDGNIGVIIARTAPVLTAWLERHSIPYDELHFGKPWSGKGGFYIDDKAIRPREFLALSYEEIRKLISNE